MASTDYDAAGYGASAAAYGASAAATGGAGYGSQVTDLLKVLQRASADVGTSSVITSTVYPSCTRIKAVRLHGLCPPADPAPLPAGL